jgi:spoIIIJ-associated protein
MNASDAAREILEIMLRHLGHPCEVSLEADPSGDGSPGLQVTVADQALANNLIGRQGSRLEDLQHLVNKLLRQKIADAPRIRVDINHYRRQKDELFLADIRKTADEVRSTGQPRKLEPMNSYQRRLVHHAFRDDPGVRSWSPEDSGRLKRISLLPRNSSPA